MNQDDLYKIPPIVEAVLGIQCFPLLGMRNVERFRDRLKKKLPAIQVNHNVQINVDPSGSTSTSTDLAGYILRSTDGSDFVLMQRNGWVAGRMAPYIGWDDIFSKARLAFAEYSKIADRRSITRLGCRYINRIDIPNSLLAGRSVGDLFKIGIHYETETVNALGSCAISMNYKHSLYGATVQLNFGTLPPALIDSVSVSVDIDVSFTEDISMQPDRMWQQFEILRKTKNKVFESVVTDSVRRLFS